MFVYRNLPKINFLSWFSNHKDFKCDSCGKLFSNAGNMRSHIKTVHEGDKDFKSESCEKSFT